MCLGIPGEVKEVYFDDQIRMAKVDFGGIRKQVCIEHTPEAQVGDFVIVHVGFALQKIDPVEARQIFQFLEQMNELAELQDEPPPEVDHQSVPG